MWPVAFPALEALGGVIACAVAIVVDHVEHVALCPLLGNCVFVVWTVHVQVVIYAHVDMVVSAMEPRSEEKNKKVTFFIRNIMK